MQLGGGGPGLGQTYPPGFLLHVLAMLSTSNLHPELAVQVARVLAFGYGTSGVFYISFFPSKMS
jgi:hypothetical protein